MENIQIRKLLKLQGIPLWKIAKEIGISEPTMTRWMRYPLDSEKQKKILTAIEKIEGAENDEEN